MDRIITGPVTTVYIMGEGAPVIVHIKLFITGTRVVSNTALGIIVYFYTFLTFKWLLLHSISYLVTLEIFEA